MAIFDVVVRFLTNKGAKMEVLSTHCPNCWGRQEYEGRFLQTLSEEKIDLNNVKEKKGWIQAYAARHFEGIKLRKTKDYFECPACKLTYRPTGKSQL